MKKIAKILSPILAAILLTVGVSASELHWYLKYDGNNPPPLPSEFAFIESTGGIFRDRSEEKVIYLTFDAGYENGNVAKILDILKKHGAHGTFFVLENLIRRDTALVSRMFDEGHTVANHTMSHKNMADQPREVFEAELTGLADLCRELTGHEMAKLYRPPEGTFSESDLAILADMGYRTVFWSCAYADWDNNKQPSPEAALEKLRSRLHPGEILLLHPTSATNAAILDEFLTELAADGWRFGELTELCGS
ncbi:MAG: delta-lactam-biosynthetic de-N-acetylase [Ruminococcaceae bacterium]|nr:delta-lactam-biosynthetic de-N-acetylase [Oscillospiraceae bacterium]